MQYLVERLLSVENPKAEKALSYGYLNGIHYMAPHALSGRDLCGNASPGCMGLCLGAHSGAAVRYSRVMDSRIAKAQSFIADRKAYLEDLHLAIALLDRKARRAGLKPVVRLNGSTDLAFEGFRFDDGSTLFSRNPSVQFVDYTKSIRRALKYADGRMPVNYHLTLSRSETNESHCMDVMRRGVNVAIVFGAKALPETYRGIRVINGDESDLRHLDPQGGFWVGLTPKGSKAKRDVSGFVVRDMVA
jgi:hypothetical protein